MFELVVCNNDTIVYGRHVCSKICTYFSRHFKYQFAYSIKYSKRYQSVSANAYFLQVYSGLCKRFN